RCGAETGERVAHGARHAARRGRIGAEARGDGAVELIVHDLPLADLAVGARAPALRVGRVAARCDTHREACTAEVEVTDEAAVLAGRARPVALRKLELPARCGRRRRGRGRRYDRRRGEGATVTFRRASDDEEAADEAGGAAAGCRALRHGAVGTRRDAL